MPRLEVLPFADEHLEDASTLLAARHARHREAEPLLPSRYEATEPAREELTAVWNAEGVSGAIAFSNGKAVGYLIGAPRSAEEWGENVWVELAGHAVENAEDIRDLYAVAAAPWFDDGNRRHYVLVPGHDSALIDAWFRLGFGHQQGHGIREVPLRTEVRVPKGFEIREPREEDIDQLVPVDLALSIHQGMSPVFSTRPLQSVKEIKAEWSKTLVGDEEKLLMACADGRPVACWSVCDARHSRDFTGLGLPERAVISRSHRRCLTRVARASALR
jgi:hypothetical protein